jgi:flagellar biosynthetic protein FliQ
MDPYDIDLAVELGQQTLWVAVKLAFPILLVGLFVGVSISVLQAATQIQEQTLTFIPKMFAVVVVLFALMPWFLMVLVEFTEELFQIWVVGWR